MDPATPESPVPRELPDHIWNSLHSPCDFTIECAGGSVYAHKQILAAESDYFNGLINGSMREAESGTVRLLDIPVAIMTAMIDFIYSGRTTVTLTIEDALDLIIPARYLLVNSLVAKCVDSIKANLSLGNVAKVFCTAEPYASDGCLHELRQLAFTFLLNNVSSLATTASFLDDADANLISVVLASDDIIVPDEDAVFNLFAAWFHRDEGARMRYVPDLRELIRFPFLRVSTAARFEEMFGPIEALSRFRRVGWSQEALPAAFRRRRYTTAHCHFLWQQSDPERRGTTGNRLVLTCNPLGQSEHVLIYGDWTNGPYIRNVTVNGHTIYSWNIGSVYSYEGRPGLHRATAPLQPREIATVSDRYVEKIVGLCSTKEGALHMVTMLASPKIYVLNTETNHFQKLAIPKPSAAALLPWSNRPVLDLTLGHLIDPVTGRREKLSMPPYAEDVSISGKSPESEKTLLRWKAGSQRDDNILLWYHFPLTNRLFMSSLNLSNEKWATAIEARRTNLWTDHWRSEIVRGDIYVLACLEPDRPICIDKLDEKRGEFVPVQQLELQGRRFVGVVPTDIGPPCAMDTWLCNEIRKLLDDTPSQRALIDQLRQLVK